MIPVGHVVKNNPIDEAIKEYDKMGRWGGLRLRTAQQGWGQVLDVKTETVIHISVLTIEETPVIMMA